MLRWSRTSIVVVLVLAVLAVGCGDGGSGGTADGAASETTAGEGGETGTNEGGGSATTEAGGGATGGGGRRTIEATTVTDSSFEADVLLSGKPVLVHFWAEWCGPCRVLTPVLEEVAGEHEDTLTVARLNVDDNTETPSRFEVESIPTLVLFVDGVEKKRLTGTLSKGDIDSALGEVIG